MTLWRYLLSGFGKSVAAVFAVIAIVVLLFGFVETLRRFGGQAGAGDLVRLTLLQAPEVLYQVLPLVMMLASLVTFLRFARTSELVVMRAAGVSALRLISVPVVASLAIGVLTVAAINPFVAASSRRSLAVEDEFSRSGASFLSFSVEGLWLRQADEGGGQTVIQAARTNSDGTILSNVRLHRFDAGGQLFGRIEAPAARLTDGAWLLEAATLWQADPGGAFEKVSSGARLTLPTMLTSGQILDSFSPPEMVGIWGLRSFIAQMEEAGFSGVRHRLFLQSEIAKPALFAAMVLIGSAFALRPSRFGQTGVMMLLAVLAGFVLYFVTDFSASLGAQGQVPILVAAWTPPVAAILLALALLLHLEDG